MVFGAACSSGSDSAKSPTTISPTSAVAATAIPKGATPKPTLQAAVEGLLTAEQEEDHAASYAFIDAAGRAKYRDVADWTDRRTGLAPVTGFTIDTSASSATKVVAVVTHEPGLDPFIGLSTAEERQTWTGTKTSKGYLAEADPVAALVLPAESTIETTVHDWAVAVQACDQKQAETFQVSDSLFGESDGATTLCHSTGAITTGPIGLLAAGPASADIVAQYSSDVLTWARTMTVGGPTTFVVVLAPIGPNWKVLGVADP